MEAALSASTMWNGSRWDACHFDVAPISTNLILAFIGQNVLGMPCLIEDG